MGLRFEVSTADPHLFFVFEETGRTVGAFTAHIDDILGCGEPYGLLKIREFPEQRFG